jgi:outer membrane protein assembly factor BamB
VVAVLACGFAAGLVAPGHVLGQADSIWQYTSGADVDWLRVQRGTPQLLVATAQQITALDTRSAAVQWQVSYAGPLQFVTNGRSGPTLVGSGVTIIAIDPLGGRVLWERGGLPELARTFIALPAPGMPILVQDSTSVQALSVATGASLWHSGALAGDARVREFFSLDRLGLVVLLAQAPGGTTSLIGVSADSGTVRWRRDDVFITNPAYRRRRGVSALKDYQLAFVGDTAFVLYATTDGPILIDARNGTTSWQGAALNGRGMAALEDGYMPMCLCEGHLLVPFQMGIAALDPATGSLRWEAKLPDAPTWVEPSSAGLLLIGRERASFAILLDGHTGQPKWGPTPIGDETRIVWNPDTLAAIRGNKLIVIPLATGSVLELAKIRFKDQERPQQLQARPGGGYVVLARQNLMAVSADGAVLYSRYYPAPSPSFGDRLLGGDKKGTAFATSMIYYGLAEGATTSTGTSYFILAASLADGTEFGRLTVKERDPSYAIDTRLGYAFVLSGRRDITARDFHVPAPLLTPVTVDEAPPAASAGEVEASP